VAVSDNDGAAARDFERRLATILSADVAAYSRLMAEDEEETLRVFRGHKEVFEKLVALHRGRIFNTAGDAILAEFGSAVEAVRCATEIQSALRTRNDQFPEDRQVQFRIGVNLGDVMVQDHDLLGDGVNVAARLQGAAAPGGICIAGSVYDQIRNRLSLSFKPLGDMKYKNIPQAVRTFSIVEAEGIGELPAPIDGPERGAGAFPRWLAAVAGALLLVAAGAGGLWLYSDHQHPTPAAPTVRSAAERSAAMPTPAAPEKSAVVTPSAAPSAEPPRTDAAPEATPPAATTAAPVAAGEPPQPANSASLTTTASDGLYAGPVCFGPGPVEGPGCFRAQATVRQGRITGQWPGRDPGVTMHLEGDVLPSGVVSIHMHADEASGKRRATINLTGTLLDGKLNANGAFLNGRSASLNWRKN
jgi:class 3 adenylate cyclase